MCPGAKDIASQAIFGQVFEFKSLFGSFGPLLEKAETYSLRCESRIHRGQTKWDVQIVSACPWLREPHSQHHCPLSQPRAVRVCDQRHILQSKSTVGFRAQQFEPKSDSRFKSGVPENRWPRRERLTLALSVLIQLCSFSAW